jgi:hypothetical protein
MKWISLKEYEQHVLKVLADKPVIKMLVNGSTPFEKWASNIHHLIDKETGAVREMRVALPESPTPVLTEAGDKFTMQSLKCGILMDAARHYLMSVQTDKVSAEEVVENTLEKLGFGKNGLESNFNVD